MYCHILFPESATTKALGPRIALQFIPILLTSNLIIFCTKGCEMNGGCIDDVRKTSNGAEVARRIPREQAKFRARSRNVAAIDFGTTNCSIAYLTEADSPEQEPHRLLLNGTYERVPTAILFKEDGTFVSFGNEARQDYLNLDDDARPNYLYFEQIKMKLQQDEVRTPLHIFCFGYSYVQSIST